MVGASGGEFGIRGFVAAFDLGHGEGALAHLHRARAGRAGKRDLAEGRSMEDRRCAGVGERQLRSRDQPRYWGTGNGGPTIGDQRPGDNLYVTSTIAIDVATGADQRALPIPPERFMGLGRGLAADPRGLSPQRPHDQGTDRRGAQRLHLVPRAQRRGRFNFVEGKPFVIQNVFRSLDPVTGRPDVDPEHKPMTGKRADFCPGVHGGKNWPPIAFSPRTRMIYIPANNNLCGSNMGVQTQYTRRAGLRGHLREPPVHQAGADHVGEVQAWNVDTGQKVWTHEYQEVAELGRRCSRRLAASSSPAARAIARFTRSTPRRGKLLWEFPMNSGALAPPSSFSVDGKQYIAVESGWGGDSRGMQATLNNLFPGEYPEVPEGGAIWVFAVD